ncbi:Hypothetical protein, putative [Bodo saltans]|uniref:Vps52 coiled-coil domain-containing protein n=1 Tax=Bodo saltans TaxID=75058 RepID=A0A0S4JX74_BODSA|nr:Hypothetical protein, putative [Bodo saltans]|eukprot:CUG93750.1 Hypothetical protein, putative [Bodo saltans]
MDTLDADFDIETLMRSLDDVDGLMAIAAGMGDEQQLINKHLNSGVDLKVMLASQEKELRAVQELFIEQHCAQAENLCTLYNEVSECESKLLSFEEQIFAFQKTLTDTADDIVKMQEQTVDLVHRVANRKHVSNKINEVYNALNECEEFCEEFANKEVTKDYLLNIRKLENKIAFLANNKGLENSSVDQEIRPKLRLAAQRAGDKLHRYLGKKIHALAEDSTNIQLQQQALESVGQYAYSFLDRYNKPVADDLKETYVRTMSEVYHRQMRHASREFHEVISHSTTCFFFWTMSEVYHRQMRHASKEFHEVITHSTTCEPILSSDIVRALKAGSDSGAGGNFFLPPPQVVTSSHNHRRTSSVSVEAKLRGFADKVRGKSEGRATAAPTSKGPPPTRSTDIKDIVDGVTSVDLSYAATMVNINPVPAIDLNQTTSWLWRLVKMFVAIVNMVTGESAFVSSFFYAHGQDLEAEEYLTRAILQRALDSVHSLVAAELPNLRDRLSCLAASRHIDQMKSFLCQCANPIPLLVLSGLIETCLTEVRRTLHHLAEGDQSLLIQVSGLQLAQLPAYYDASTTSLANALQQNPKIRAYLSPHDVTRQFALTTGCLHLINTMQLPYTRVDGKTVAAYDEQLNQVLRSSLTAWGTIVDHLAKRHQQPVAQYVFRIQNYSYLLLLWKSLCEHLRAGIVCGSGSTSSASTSQTPALLRGPFVAPQAQVESITFLLKNEVVRYVAADSKRFSMSGIVSLMQEAEVACGASPPSTNSPAPTLPAITSLPPALQDQQILATLSTFAKTWKEQLEQIAGSVRASFRLAPELERARSITRDAAGHLRCYKLLKSLQHSRKHNALMIVYDELRLRVDV